MIEACPTVGKNEWQRASSPDNFQFTQSQSPTGELVDSEEASKKRVMRPLVPKRPGRSTKRATESVKKSLDWVSSTSNYLARSRGQKSVVQPHLTTAEDATNIKVTREEASKCDLRLCRRSKAQNLMMKLQYIP